MTVERPDIPVQDLDQAAAALDTMITHVRHGNLPDANRIWGALMQSQEKLEDDLGRQNLGLLLTVAIQRLAHNGRPLTGGHAPVRLTRAEKIALIEKRQPGLLQRVQDEQDKS